ncbi:hypothetical protein BJ508DRAFT_358609 [Ascobolus immersus RN42]|uniref:C2H2-type domain-containing protein n=1 Tax=Ascobolus immersus RN42 TaxID=1160509 RepID=A0A3N4IJN5_ASCIM|nr:hypothetical protein BJ508DRAFT_358609 [Ascobolus immersus RN42]
MRKHDETQLFSNASRCRDNYQKLLKILRENQSEETSITISDVEDELLRFKVWAGNIGALQRGAGSLDFRLRGARQVRTNFARLLTDLEETLDEIFPIANGHARSFDGSDSDEDSGQDDEDIDDDGFSDTSDRYSNVTSGDELKELWESAKATLTGLFRLSMVIRKRKKKRYAKWETAVEFAAAFDVQHTRDKFPTTVSKAPWLVERLGTANARRRQYFLYRRDHREKLAYESKPLPDGENASECERYNENNSDTARSETSYAFSESDGDNKIEVPRAPRGYLSGPVECPFCWEIQEIGDFRSWKKHVFSDLEPYVCTEPDCTVNPFASRHEWFDHELQFHKNGWICIICTNTFRELATMKEHIKSVHPNDVRSDQIDAIVEGCRGPPRPLFNTDCPFCDIWKQQHPSAERIPVTQKDFQRHVGKHMEQLALFTLPKLDDRSYEEADPTTDQDDSIRSHAEVVTDDKLECGSLYSEKAPQEPNRESADISDGDLDSYSPLLEPIENLKRLRREEQQRKLGNKAADDHSGPSDSTHLITEPLEKAAQEKNAASALEPIENLKRLRREEQQRKLGNKAADNHIDPIDLHDEGHRPSNISRERREAKAQEVLQRLRHEEHQRTLGNKAPDDHIGPIDLHDKSKGRYCPSDIVMVPVDTSLQAEVAASALEELRRRSRIEKQRAKDEKESNPGKLQEKDVEGQTGCMKLCANAEKLQRNSTGHEYIHGSSREEKSPRLRFLEGNDGQATDSNRAMNQYEEKIKSGREFVTVKDMLQDHFDLPEHEEPRTTSGMESNRQEELDSGIVTNPAHASRSTTAAQLETSPEGALDSLTISKDDQHLSGYPFNPDPSDSKGQYCPVCGVFFRRASDLQRHIREQHSDSSEPRFQCGVCLTKFRRRAQLQDHQRRRGHQDIQSVTFEI